MFVRLKFAIEDAREKQRKEKRQYRVISFSWVVGPSVSMYEKILVFGDGMIRFDSAFMINKQYDAKTLTNRRIGVSVYENKKGPVLTR
jgi:hypothetical protein